MTADDTIDDWTDPYRDVPPPEFEPAPEEFDYHDDVVIPFDRQEREQQREAPAASKREAKPRPRRLTLTTPDAPMVVARELIKALWTDEQGRETLRYWRGGWVNYVGTHWEHRDKDSVRAEVYRTLEQALKRGADGVDPTPWTPNTKRVNQVLDALISACHVDTDREEDRGEYIALQNGLLHLKARVLEPHTPDWFSFTCLPFDYDPLAGSPDALLTFMDSAWGDDQVAKNLLQEWLGYVVGGGNEKAKALFLVGQKRSGKGTILRLILDLVGKQNNAPLSISGLSEKYGLEGLIGKVHGTVADARLDGRAAAMLIERILMITGGDALDVRRMGIPAWYGTLSARLTFASNAMPRLNDAAGVVASRFLILTMPHSAYGKEDEHLGAKLRAELPAIFNFALAGLDRLTERGHFVEPESAAEDRAILEDLASPVGVFLRERCVVEPGKQAVQTELYTLWCEWAKKNGHEPGSKTKLTQSLKALIPRLGTRGWTPSPNRQRAYDGVEINHEAVTAEDGVQIGTWARSGEPIRMSTCHECGSTYSAAYGFHRCVHGSVESEVPLPPEPDLPDPPEPELPY